MRHRGNASARRRNPSLSEGNPSTAERSSSETDSPRRRQQTRHGDVAGSAPLQRAWVTRFFVNKDDEADFELWQMRRTIRAVFCVAFFLGLHDFFNEEWSWQHGQADGLLSTTLHWAKILRAVLPVLSGVFIGAILFRKWETRRAVICYQLCIFLHFVGLPGACAFIAASKGYPIPGSVLAVAGLAALTGLPWIYHLGVTVVHAIIFLIGRSLYLVDPFNPEVVTDWLKALGVLVVLSYMCDSALRTDFETRQRLRKFRHQLNAVVSQLAKQDSGKSNGLDHNAQTAASVAIKAVAHHPHTVLKSTSSPEAKSSDRRPPDSQKRKQALATPECVDSSSDSDSELGQDLVGAVCKSLQRAQDINSLLIQAEARQSFFLAAMSHELRSPLTTVLGCTDLLGSVRGLNAEAKQYVQLIQSAGHHLLTIINDILDFSKITSDNVDFRLSPSVFDPRLLATTATKMFVPQAMSNNVKLKVETSELPAEIRVRGDETRIEQILVNFLSNAIKFTPHGGEVTLTLAAWRPSLNHLEALAAVARKEQTAALIKGGRVADAESDASASDALPSTSAEGRPIMLSISVKDTGIGMSPEVQENLFQAFRQGHVGGSTRQYGGTGLGLCISAKIAALMGCPKVQVTSAVGKGSTFKVDLLLEEVNRNQRHRHQCADTSWIADADAMYAPESTQTSRHQLAKTQFTGPHLQAKLRDTVEHAAVSATLYEFDPAAGRKQSPTGQHFDLEKPSASRIDPNDLNDSESIPAPLPLSGFRILLAEDVKSIRMLGQRMLSRAGAKCTTAADGVLAVAAVRASIAKNDPFDCILMDFHMPNMDGMEAMQSIRATHGAHAPVVFGFTADVLDNTAHTFIAGGAVAVLNKPYNLNDIVTHIHEFCAKAKKKKKS